ncbi:helicase-associated domain-containing protein [Nonomuraea sp. NPDC005650]|uniref:helicase-associated domain-containing protein n=1 Tax=Nonomuraea sp. NPDC005650 TaxID=3157045 RepID=UPI0033ACB338
MSLPAADLARLLHNRPELAAAPSPEALERLLAAPELAVPALLALDADCHLASQALQILGGEASRAALAELVHDPGDRLGETLETLAAWGLVVLDGDGEAGTVTSPHRPGLWANPFGLGRPLRELTAEDLKSLVKGLGGKPKGRRPEVLAQAAEIVGDGPAVRARAATLPPAAVTLLESMADGEPVYQHAVWYGTGQADHPVTRLAEAGFVVRDGWEYELPMEVALALRGDGWKPELTGQPDVPSAELAADPDGLAAALAAVDRMEALIELAGTQPIAELKAGGVGARELKRTAKTLDATEQAVTLWLDLAFGTELIASETGERLVSTTLADTWLGLDPASRWKALVDTWLAVPQAATFRVTGCCPEHMTPHAPPYQFESGAGEIRRATLRVLQTLPPGRGSTPAGLRPAVEWRTRAVKEFAQAATEFVAAALREGELLGMVHEGALTELGRAHLDGAEVAARFPAPSRTVTLQNDLTAIVSGVPAPELTAFLNGCADLESRDRASVWRFSQKSVRRALDAGTTADGLLEELARVSAKAVPQPLSYLVTDVARRHGAVRVASAACVLTAEDPALITELCGTKALRKLALRPVAPTVALSALPPEETLQLLRQSGHAPVALAPDGTVKAEPPQRRRLPVESEPVLDATAILHGGEPATPAEALAVASVTGEPIVIVWQRREHYMEDIELTRGTVSGYCHDCGTDHTYQRARIKEAYLP